jgi:hypothetical protein
MTDVLDVEPPTRRTYESMLGKHIRPLMGSLQMIAGIALSVLGAGPLRGDGSERDAQTTYSY